MNNIWKAGNNIKKTEFEKIEEEIGIKDEFRGDIFKITEVLENDKTVRRKDSGAPPEYVKTLSSLLKDVNEWSEEIKWTTG